MSSWIPSHVLQLHLVLPAIIASRSLHCSRSRSRSRRPAVPSSFSAHHAGHHLYCSLPALSPALPCSDRAATQQQRVPGPAPIFLPGRRSDSAVQPLTRHLRLFCFALHMFDKILASVFGLRSSGDHVRLFYPACMLLLHRRRLADKFYFPDIRYFDYFLYVPKTTVWIR